MSTAIKGVYVEDYKKDTLFYIHELNTSVLSIRNMIDGNLEFGAIDAKGLYFNMKTYKNDTDTNLDVFLDKLDANDTIKTNTPSFLMSSSEIKLSESRFKLSDENIETATILNFDALDIAASDFKIEGSKVALKVNQLSLEGEKGLSVKNLTADFKYTTAQMRFDEFAIETAESKLNGNLVFDYNSCLLYTSPSPRDS